MKKPTMTWAIKYPNGEYWLNPSWTETQTIRHIALAGNGEIIRVEIREVARRRKK